MFAPGGGEFWALFSYKADQVCWEHCTVWDKWFGSRAEVASGLVELELSVSGLVEFGARPGILIFASPVARHAGLGQTGGTPAVRQKITRM